MAQTKIPGDREYKVIRVAHKPRPPVNKLFTALLCDAFHNLLRRIRMHWDFMESLTNRAVLRRSCEMLADAKCPMCLRRYIPGEKIYQCDWCDLRAAVINQYVEADRSTAQTPLELIAHRLC